MIIFDKNKSFDENIDAFCEKVKAGIDGFLANISSEQKSRVRYFYNKIFLNSEANSAKLFKAALNNKNYTNLQKLLIVYAIFANESDNSLKNFVAESFFNEGKLPVEQIIKRGLDELRMLLKDHAHKGIKDCGQIKDFNEIVGKIINYTNSFSMGEKPADFPDEIWGSITKKHYYVVCKGKIRALKKTFLGVAPANAEKEELEQLLLGSSTVKLFTDFARARAYADSMCEVVNTKGGLNSTSIPSNKVAPIFTVDIKDTIDITKLDSEEVTHEENKQWNRSYVLDIFNKKLQNIDKAYLKPETIPCYEIPLTAIAKVYRAEFSIFDIKTVELDTNLVVSKSVELNNN